MDNAPPTRHADPRLLRLAVIALLLGATGIAFAPIFVKLSVVGPVATAMWRMALALPLLGALTAVRSSRRPAAPADRPPRWRLALPGLFLAGDLAVWHWSLACTSAANATLFANCAPILVVAVGWLWLKERIGPLFLTGLATALVGVVVIAYTSSQGEAGDRRLLGDALGLLTAFFYAAYQLSVKRLRGHHDTLTIMTWATAAAFLVLIPVSLISPQPMLTASLVGWAVLIGLALVSHILGQGLITWSLAHVPVSFSSVSLLFQPVAAAALAWVILREPLVPWQAAGGAAVLAGVFLARHDSLRRMAAETADGKPNNMEDSP